MGPLNYLGIAVIIGGGWLTYTNLKDLYTRGCHTPALYLIGSFGVVAGGIWLAQANSSSTMMLPHRGESSDAE